MATYPPFSVWTKERGARCDAGLQSPPVPVCRRHVPHIPFWPQALPLLLFPGLHRQECQRGRDNIDVLGTVGNLRAEPAIEAAAHFVTLAAAHRRSVDRQLRGWSTSCRRSAPARRRGDTFECERGRWPVQAGGYP